MGDVYFRLLDCISFFFLDEFRIDGIDNGLLCVGIN